jgi:L-threonylcarbamoyladenylate synthase
VNLGKEVEHEQESFLAALKNGEVIAYPTEAVFGLGCDPDNEQAVQHLLALKNRSVDKGLILVARTYSQLLPYIDDKSIPMDKRTGIFSSWPGPITWLLPASVKAPGWITGDSKLIAVRVSQHPVVQQLCEWAGKPLVSTSANVAGVEPAKTADEVVHQFADKVLLVEGDVGGRDRPSEIRNGLTGQIIRAS